jgi:hypothetical protein
MDHNRRKRRRQSKFLEHLVPNPQSSPVISWCVSCPAPPSPYIPKDHTWKAPFLAAVAPVGGKFRDQWRRAERIKAVGIVADPLPNRG